MGHGRLKIELGIERRGRSVRHPHGDSFIRDTIEGLYSQSEQVSTTLASSGVFRPKSEKIFTSAVGRAESKSGCVPIRTLDSTSQ